MTMDARNVYFGLALAVAVAVAVIAIPLLRRLEDFQRRLDEGSAEGRPPMTLWRNRVGCLVVMAGLVASAELLWAALAPRGNP
jgi:hypothetical protein